MMTERTRHPRLRRVALTALALALVAGAMGRPARAQAPPAGFPRIPIWSFAGGACTTCGADSIVKRPRAVTVRFLRDRRVEARRDFGGYRIYRAIGAPDTSTMVLVRRFSRNPVSELTWNFSVVDTLPSSPTYMQFLRGGLVVHDSVVTFVDPDSNGNFVKVCRRRDNLGRCLSRGDSVWVLEAPPGPHDGFPVYYSITYESRNNGPGTYEDLFVDGGPDTLDAYARCGTAGDPSSCPRLNLNHKALNLTPRSGEPLVEPTRGPTADLEQVRVVPNPYRAREVWDRPGANELHFINLPSRSTIKIFTLSGDLVKQLEHRDDIRDFERWDLRNAKDQPVASGIYLYRVESGSFAFQDRFVVIR